MRFSLSVCPAFPDPARDGSWSSSSDISWFSSSVELIGLGTPTRMFSVLRAPSSAMLTPPMTPPLPLAERETEDGVK